MIVKQAMGVPCYANNRETKLVILYSTAPNQTLRLEVSTNTVKHDMKATENSPIAFRKITFALLMVCADVHIASCDLRSQEPPSRRVSQMGVCVCVCVNKYQCLPT